MATRDEMLNTAWDAIREHCCSSKKDALRVVMLSKADLAVGIDALMPLLLPAGCVAVCEWCEIRFDIVNKVGCQGSSFQERGCPIRTTKAGAGSKEG